MMITDKETSSVQSAIRGGRDGRRSRLRVLNRIVFMGCAVFIPLYIGIRLTGGSAEKLNELPDLLDRVKTPILWEVPADGLRYLHFHHGEARQDHKFVLVRLRMQARMKIAYPIVPHCFRLLADDGSLHFPLSRSPLFIDKGTNEFYLDRDDSFEGELLFEIPQSLDAERLLFDRYVRSGEEGESGTESTDAGLGETRGTGGAKLGSDTSTH